MGDLTASADIHGLAIDLALAWSAPSTQTRNLRVVRRRWGYPASASDGLVVLDLADLFMASGAPWARIDRQRFLLLNARAEGGILQAELAEYYADASAPEEPSQVVVRVYDSATDKLKTSPPLQPVSRVASTAGTSLEFGAVATITIFTKPAGGNEEAVGTAVISTRGVNPGPLTSVTIYTQPAGGAEAPVVVSAQGLDQFEWTAAGAAKISASFVWQEKQRTAATLRPSALLDVTFVTSLVTTVGPQEVELPIRTVHFTEALDLDSGDVARTIAIVDQEPPGRDARGLDPGLTPEVMYYYAAFQDAGTGLSASPGWTASSMATGRYDFAERLYALLPAVHRYHDDPAAGQQPGSGRPGSWQLRRFLQVLGPVLDQARSLGEALAKIHDLFEARAGDLSHLAHWIGWELNRTLPTQRQRTDILLAPEIFATVGTVPNLQALVNRATGWDCQVKEFVNNVFLTNAVESIRLWEIWKADGTTGAFDPASPVIPTAVTQAVSDSNDGRPAIVADPAGGAPWLFWHSDRPVTAQSPLRRRLWTMQASGTDTPHPVMLDFESVADEWPAVVGDVIAGVNVIRLFWSSNRGGRQSLWTSTLTNGVPGAAVQLTDHPAGDQCPAVAKEGNGKIWLFWQSSRRGPMDIWAMTLNPGATAWSAPQRITTGQARHGTPAAILDATNQLRLFWSADLGDHSRLFQSTLSGVAWSEPVDISSGVLAPGEAPLFRDEAPAAVLSGGGLWAFWHSDRDGITRLWASQQTGSAWGAPFRVTSGRSAEKDPAPFVASGALRLFFRTQRGGEVFRSRTVDFANLGAIKRGQADDRWHYTYSVEITPTSFYSRDAVGIYMIPDDTWSNVEHQAERDRVQALVEPFRPLPVRFVWFLKPPSVTELLYSPVDIGESYTDVYPIVEHLGAIDESYTVALPGWSVIHTNTVEDVSANPEDLTTLRRRVFFKAPT